jgi:predicted nuclease of predicted toxin-antitoxin system
VKFIADENVSRSVIQSLMDAGHDVVSVYDIGLAGTADDALIRLGITEGRFIITHDTDFGGLLRYPARESSGVFLIRLHRPSPKNVWRALQKALVSVDEAKIRRRVVVIEDTRIRVSGKGR